MSPIITAASLADIGAIRTLYRSVASVEGGIARKKDEVTTEYVSSFVKKSIQSGVILIAVDEATSDIVGEIHCYTPGIDVFAHVLGELTIAVHPSCQGMGIGRRLFERLLETVRVERPEIRRVELIARESNVKAIRLYESLGFRIEGRFEQRIKRAGGGYEADIPMAWITSE
jgi:ribosomal protein S18 acetylase RimI-like enzyme